MGVSIIHDNILYGFPITILEHLDFGSDTFVGSIVRETVHRDGRFLPSNLQRGLTCIVEGLHTLARYINGNNADVLCGGVASIVSDNSLQGQFSCVLTQAAQIKLKGVVGKGGTRCLSRIEESNSILRCAVHEVYTHDTVRCLLATCLGNRHDGCFHNERATCLAVERIILERYGNGSTCATTTASTDVELYFIAHIVAIGINKFHFYYTLRFCIDIDTSRNMSVRATC